MGTFILECQDSNMVCQRDTIQAHFGIISDFLEAFPNSNTVKVEVKTREVSRLLDFVNNKPTNDQEWHDLILAAAYLQINMDLLKKIHPSFQNYIQLTGGHGPYITDPYPFPEYIKRLQDRNYRTPKEASHVRMLEGIFGRH